MRLTVLGCSGTFPGPTSPCSSYLLEADGFRLLLDVGNGALGSLQRYADLLAPDAVLLSHLHGDHYLDLVPYTYARRYHPDGPAPVLPVYGPESTAKRLRRSVGSKSMPLLDEVYEIREIGPGDMEIGPFSVTLVPVRHPVPCNAIRLSAGGRTLTYSADTGACDGLVEAAKGADLFLCEAAYLDGQPNPPGIHLTGREAGEHATAAGVGRLVLTHLVPWGDGEATRTAAAAAYTGPVDLARCGATYDV